MSEKRINFGKIAYYGSQKKVNQVEIEIELKECKEGPVFSACAFVYNSRHTDCVAGGQCLDDLYKFFRGNKDFKNIYMLWERNHLNDMHAGTIEQENCLKEFANEKDTIREELRKSAWEKAKAEIGYSDNYFNEWQRWHGSAWDNYSVDCELLKRHGLYEVKVDGKPYKYGQGWLYRPISDEDLKLIKHYLEA